MLFSRLCCGSNSLPAPNRQFVVAKGPTERSSSGLFNWTPGSTVGVHPHSTLHHYRIRMFRFAAAEAQIRQSADGNGLLWTMRRARRSNPNCLYSCTARSTEHHHHHDDFSILTHLVWGPCTSAVLSACIARKWYTDSIVYCESMADRGEGSPSHVGGILIHRALSLWLDL